MRTVSALAVFCASLAWGANPAEPAYWSAAQLNAIDQKLAANVNPETHVAVERLMDGVTVLHRNGPSGAEIHTNLADFITIQKGEGWVLVGGTIVDGKPSGPGEVRGKSIEGGKKYPFKAGDNLYIPANMVHQFFVDPGQELSLTIVKIAPKQ
jgi:mannose-6-phosphate isomerase-like protein (cupin superfamily)